MTQVADSSARSDRPSPDRRHDLCPFLVADGAWRSALPAGEHRCLALGEDVPLSLDKQRRLCLSAEHRSCPAYVGALAIDERAGDLDAAAHPRRPYPRMAPVVLDHGRVALRLPAIPRDRPAGQIALAALMVLAFSAIALARLTGVTDGGVPGAPAAPSPQPSLLAVAPSPTPAPTPSPEASLSLEPSSPPEPLPTPKLRTYKIKRGDTLIGIAGHFGTSVKKLIALNKVKDPSRIAIGTVLKIPPDATGP